MLNIFKICLAEKVQCNQRPSIGWIYNVPYHVTLLYPNKRSGYIQNNVLNTLQKTTTFKMYPTKWPHLVRTLDILWMCWPNLPKLHFEANSECNLHVPIRPHLDPSVQSIENMPILYPLGILESDICEYWKCTQLFAHWVHWSQMAGHIQNVLSMCPLGISGPHNRVYLQCTQHLITGHIGVTCWLWSQCFHHVPSGYLGPCPQWEKHTETRTSDPGRIRNSVRIVGS